MSQGDSSVSQVLDFQVCGGPEFRSQNPHNKTGTILMARWELEAARPSELVSEVHGSSIVPTGRTSVSDVQGPVSFSQIGQVSVMYMGPVSFPQIGQASVMYIHGSSIMISKTLHPYFV